MLRNVVVDVVVVFVVDVVGVDVVVIYAASSIDQQQMQNTTSNCKPVIDIQWIPISLIIYDVWMLHMWPVGCQ
jgi:hypothetical protein